MRQVALARATWLILLGTLCLATEPAAAQRPSALRVGADNDAFNFWLPPWERTDQEYTSGVRGSLDYEGRSRLLGALMKRIGRPCEAIAICVTHSYTLGQAIFTAPPGAAQDAADAGTSRVRPNAGWLYLQASERDSSAARMDELSVAAGVVGPPALGETMQRFFHSLGPEFQRPVDWSRQLPFEPGFIARYTHTAFARPWVNNETWRAIGFASAGGALGTILTEGVIGAGVRTDAILPGYETRWYVPRIDVSLEGRVRGIIRDEFLDGTFFRSSERVKRKPVVVEQTVGAALRWRRLALSYRVSHAGKQYDSQPKDANWGSLGAEWRLYR